MGPPGHGGRSPLQPALGRSDESMVAVWVLEASMWRTAADAPYVSDAERARPRFRRAADAHRYLAARALTRAVLSRYLGVPPGDVVVRRTCARCGDADHGRPTVRSLTPLEFSLTRNAPVVAVAVGSSRLGLDAACSDSRVPVGWPVFSAAEVARLSSAPPSMAVRLFTVKEAVGKASGGGLIDADRIRMADESAMPVGASEWAVDALGGSWSVTPIDLGSGIVTALATSDPPAGIDIVDAFPLIRRLAG
jgi:4'-phosphopantetheinyl transferase